MSDKWKDTLYAADATGSLDDPALRRKAAKKKKKRTTEETEESYQRRREADGFGRNTARPPHLRQAALRRKFGVTDPNIRLHVRRTADGGSEVDADLYDDGDRD